MRTIPELLVKHVVGQQLSGLREVSKIIIWSNSCVTFQKWKEKRACCSYIVAKLCELQVLCHLWPLSHHRDFGFCSGYLNAGQVLADIEKDQQYGPPYWNCAKIIIGFNWQDNVQSLSHANILITQHTCNLNAKQFRCLSGTTSQNFYDLILISWVPLVRSDWISVFAIL